MPLLYEYGINRFSHDMAHMLAGALDFSDKASGGITLSRQQITKELIRLLCAFLVPIWYKQVFS